MLGCDGPAEDLVPYSYAVFLHQGYSLDQHKPAIGVGVDFDSAIKFVFPETARHGPYYHADLDDGVLMAVRADLGVDMVVCNAKVYLID